jgi:hypothetical protein
LRPTCGRIVMGMLTTARRRRKILEAFSTFRSFEHGQAAVVIALLAGILLGLPKLPVLLCRRCHMDLASFAAFAADEIWQASESMHSPIRRQPMTVGSGGSWRPAEAAGRQLGARRGPFQRKRPRRSGAKCSRQKVVASMKSHGSSFSRFERWEKVRCGIIPHGLPAPQFGPRLAVPWCLCQAEPRFARTLFILIAPLFQPSF